MGNLWSCSPFLFAESLSATGILKISKSLAWHSGSARPPAAPVWSQLCHWNCLEQQTSGLTDLPNTPPFKWAAQVGKGFSMAAPWQPWCYTVLKPLNISAASEKEFAFFINIDVYQQLLLFLMCGGRGSPYSPPPFLLHSQFPTQSSFSNWPWTKLIPFLIS